MRILVVGGAPASMRSVGRLSSDPGVDPVVCAPGNAGIARQFQTVPVDPADPEAVLALAEQQQIDLTVVGPEAPLARGIVDLFSARGRAIFGPRRLAAQLETSKAFAKDFMAAPRRADGALSVSARRRTRRSPRSGAASSATAPVVKADGLAAGKGVVVPRTAPRPRRRCAR